jgi:hypothetical protein
MNDSPAAEQRHTVDTITSDALDQLYARLADAEAKRDAWHDWADTLAYKVAPADVIGRHDEDGRFPWSDALDMLTPAADVDQLKQRAERAEAAIRDALPTLKAAVDCLNANCRYHGDNLDPDHHGRRYGREACCDTGVEPRRAREAQQAIARVRAALDPQEPQPEAPARARCRCGHARDLHNDTDCAGCSHDGRLLAAHTFIAAD